MNEQLVQVASGMSEKILSGETISKAADGLQIAEDKDNDKLLENFFEKCNKTSWWSPVTIVKKLLKEGVNKIVEWCSSLADDIKKAWDSFCGNDDETITFTIKLSIATSKLIKVHTYNFLLFNKSIIFFIFTPKIIITYLTIFQK